MLFQKPCVMVVSEYSLKCDLNSSVFLLLEMMMALMGVHTFLKTFKNVTHE